MERVDVFENQKMICRREELPGQPVEIIEMCIRDRPGHQKRKRKTFKPPLTSIQKEYYNEDGIQVEYFLSLIHISISATAPALPAPFPRRLL